jgi:opacity protein-like surface antigen
MKKILLATAIVTAFAAPQAFAENAKSFEGLSVQAGTGFRHSSGQYKDIRFNAVDTGDTAAKASSSNIPLIFGIGYTAAIANDFTLGAILEYDAIKGKAGNYDWFQNGVLTTADDGNIKIKNQYTVALVPGYAFDKTTLGYAKIGFSSSKANISYADGSPNDKYSLHGWIFGLGAKKLINDNVYAFGEFNYIKNNDKNVSATDGVDTITGKIVSSAYNAIAGVGYKF